MGFSSPKRDIFQPFPNNFSLSTKGSNNIRHCGGKAIVETTELDGMGHYVSKKNGKILAWELGCRGKKTGRKLWEAENTRTCCSDQVLALIESRSMPGDVSRSKPA